MTMERQARGAPEIQPLVSDALIGYSPKVQPQITERTSKVSGTLHEARENNQGTHCAFTPVQIHKLLYSCVPSDEVSSKETLCIH